MISLARRFEHKGVYADGLSDPYKWWVVKHPDGNFVITRLIQSHGTNNEESSCWDQPGPNIMCGNDHNKTDESKNIIENKRTLKTKS